MRIRPDKQKGMVVVNGTFNFPDLLEGHRVQSEHNGGKDHYNYSLVKEIYLWKGDGVNVEKKVDENKIEW